MCVCVCIWFVSCMLVSLWPWPHITTRQQHVWVCMCICQSLSQDVFKHTRGLTSIEHGFHTRWGWQIAPIPALIHQTTHNVLTNNSLERLSSKLSFDCVLRSQMIHIFNFLVSQLMEIIMSIGQKISLYSRIDWDQKIINNVVHTILLSIVSYLLHSWHVPNVSRMSFAVTTLLPRRRCFWFQSLRNVFTSIKWSPSVCLYIVKSSSLQEITCVIGYQHMYSSVVSFLCVYLIV